MDALVKALSHRVRTPLSVISNDLNYYKTVYAQEDFLRGIARCREITDTLKLINCLGGGELVMEELSLEECFDKAFSRLKGRELSWRLHVDPGEILRADRQRFSEALALLLGIIANQDSLSVSGKIIIELGHGRLNIGFAFDKALIDQQIGPINSLTAFFSQYLGCDLVEAPLIDAVFLAHGWATEVEMSNGRLIFKIMLTS